MTNTTYMNTICISKIQELYNDTKLYEYNTIHDLFEVGVKLDTKDSNGNYNRNFSYSDTDYYKNVVDCINNFLKENSITYNGNKVKVNHLTKIETNAYQGLKTTNINNYLCIKSGDLNVQLPFFDTGNVQVNLITQMLGVLCYKVG